VIATRQTPQKKHLGEAKTAEGNSFSLFLG